MHHKICKKKKNFIHQVQRQKMSYMYFDSAHHKVKLLYDYTTEKDEGKKDLGQRMFVPANNNQRRQDQRSRKKINWGEGSLILSIINNFPSAHSIPPVLSLSFNLPPQGPALGVGAGTSQRTKLISVQPQTHHWVSISHPTWLTLKPSA